MFTTYEGFHLQHSPSLLILKYYFLNIEVEAPLTHVEGAKKGKLGGEEEEEEETWILSMKMD